MPKVGPRTVGLGRATATLLRGGLFGKLSGIARELLVAATFGTTGAAAAFRIAQTATLIPLNLITSDSLNSAFIPLYGKLHRESAVEAAQFYRSVQILLAICTTVVMIPSVVWADKLVAALAPGLSSAASEQAASLCRIMLLGLPLFVLGAVSSYLCLASGYPSVLSIRATLQNVTLLAGATAAWSLNDVTMLGWGFLAGCILYSAVSAAFVWRHRLLPPTPIWPGFASLRFSLSPFFKVMKGLIFIPVLLQLNEVAERVIASLLGDEVVAATEYANFVADTMIVLLAVPVGFAALGSISNSLEPLNHAKETAAKIVPYLLLVSLPLSVLIAFNSVSIVRFIYQRGEFTETSSLVTATVLGGFAIGLWAQVLGYVLLKILSATLQTWKLVRANTISLAVGLIVMSFGIPTESSIFLGLGGSAYGLTCLSLVSVELKIHMMILQWIGRFSPATVLVVSYSLVAEEIFPRLWYVHCFALCVLWIAAMAVTRNTRSLLLGARSRLSS